LSEAWRRKSYYPTRVLIGTDDTLNSSFPDGLLCLTGGELNILRNLMQYATRRANWVSTYESNSYLTPTEEEWDELQALVAGLEGKLMSDCTDLMDKLDAIYDAVACICPSLAYSHGETLASPTIMDRDDVSDVYDYSDTIPTETAASQGETDACELAQLWYAAGYELITEKVLPSVRFGFDVLLPATAAAIAIMTGGAGLPVVLGVWSVAELIQELLESTYDAAESNITNWLWSAKDDIVCAMFAQLKTGGDVTTMWGNVYDEVIAPSEDISGGDKAMVNLFMSGLSYFVAKTAWTEDSTWAQQNIVANYCDSCPLEPIIGTDWVAVPVPSEKGYKELSCSNCGGWFICNGIAFPAGFVDIGIVYKVEDITNLYHKRMGAYGNCPTPDAQMWGNTSENDYNGTFFAVNTSNIDGVECKAALAPGGTTRTTTNRISGPKSYCYHVVNPARYPPSSASVTYTWQWVVFEGTTVPEVTFL